MATLKAQSVNTTESEMKQTGAAKLQTAPVRIHHKTKSKLEQLLKQANKDHIGRRVKTDDLILFSLGLVTDEHLAEICTTTLSNKDRLELLFRKLFKDKRAKSREDFLRMLLDGMVTVQG